MATRAVSGLAGSRRASPDAEDAPIPAIGMCACERVRSGQFASNVARKNDGSPPPMTAVRRAIMEPFRHPAPLRTELSVDTTRRPLARTHGNSAGASTKRLLRELHAAPNLGEAARVAARRGEYELCVQPTAAALNVTKEGPATVDFTRRTRRGHGLSL
jgi:hypothetical protein